ncbi:V-type immunoglobulin domain-containing suppressor of T-cell activation [Channa argus]|uniref:V-type immunoglobulin domain-containing suppressor of T-cell activation n=1 Tax=Channa argus TaxID=215402 RepID=UPI0014174C78|nr:V-type immunoglobulin domain-containing suppressor of T-cell activation [Channa argus]
MEELPYGTSLRGTRFIFWFCSFLFALVTAKSERPHSMDVSAPNMYYACPEGSTVKMVCNVRGKPVHDNDSLKPRWSFTPHFDEDCMRKEGPRHLKSIYGTHNLPPGLHFGSGDHNFWMLLQNVTHADQGRYCCVILDYQVEHKHGQLLQRPHSHIVLHVTPQKEGSQNCTVWDSTPSGGSVAVALAIAACILALLSLPLILVLVYKQRQSSGSSRRGQELVRMDSEAHGHENPVFLGGSSQTKTRTVSQIMTRQSSETGRHLLSEPGTPLSPPAHGDVFFPVEDPIPESPDFLHK